MRIDRAQASDLGVRAADVAGAVRLMIAGEDQISTYKEEDEQYDVTLQLLPEQQKDPNTAPDFPLDAAARAANEAFRQVGLPTGYTYRFGGSVKILDETTRNLILAFLLASIFMYMVLAAQFDSFIHPFTIMLALPLSIPFALFSLWITGRTLNLWSAVPAP